MKLFEFVGLSRSGHHAMINWIYKNMIGTECPFYYQITYIEDTGWVHWNDATYMAENCIEHFKKIEKPDVLSISYENVETNFSHVNKSNAPLRLCHFNGWKISETKKVLFVRNFYDMLISRMKMFHTGKEGTYRATFDQEYIELWKSHAKDYLNNTIIAIKYEDWLQNKDKRVELLDKFNVKERFDNTKVSGNHSSFGDSKNYLKRFDSNLVPEHIKEIIRKDNELHYLIGKMGYDYKEI